jgi:hypothetical protein
MIKQHIQIDFNQPNFVLAGHVEEYDHEIRNYLKQYKFIYIETSIK